MPGDPSMVLHVSCEMQLPHKSDFMKQMSKHIAETLNKPETYVCVTVHDDVISHVNISDVVSTDGGAYSCARPSPALPSPRTPA